MRPDPELLEILGLPETHLQLAGEVELPAAPSDRDEGAGLLPTLAAMAAMAAPPTWSHVELPGSGVEISIPRERPSVVALPADHVETVLSGNWASRGDELLLDSHEERVIARLRVGDRPLILVVDGTSARAWEQADEPGLLEDLPESAPPSVTVPAPDMTSWLEQNDTEEWLSKEATRLAESRIGLRRAAAAGLVARLWDGGGDSAVRMAREWVRQMNEDQLALIEAQALDELASLVELLADMEKTAAESPELAPLEAEGLALRRDDLESVRMVLALADRDRLLSEGLDNLDEMASFHATMLGDLLPPLEDTDHRWYAVGWQEPDAWWAGVS